MAFLLLLSCHFAQSFPKIDNHQERVDQPATAGIVLQLVSPLWSFSTWEQSGFQPTVRG